MNKFTMEMGHIKECSCDKDRIKKFWEEETTFSTQHGIMGIRSARVKKTNGRIYDSFGFRMQFPGECDACYSNYKDSYYIGKPL